MTNQIADFVETQLASSYTPLSDTTIDLVEVNDIYGLVNQKTDAIFQNFRLTLVEKTNISQKLTVVIDGVVANGTLGGQARYTATIAESSATNLLVGVANTDDGTDADDNIIAANISDMVISSFSAGSAAMITVGAAEYNELATRVTNAVEEISDESNLIAASLESDQKAVEARVTEAQEDFETTITLQQDTFEADITAQQDEFETEQQQNFDNFVADQFKITGQPKEEDSTKLEISGGDWLDGTVERSYTASEQTPALSTTTFYELETGTGNLTSNTTEFTSGNFPICKVVTDGSSITQVINYGAAYLVGGSSGGSWDGTMTNVVYTDGLLTSFDDADGVTWTYTYDSDNQIQTIFDGTDTTTINRDSDGTFIGTTLS